MRISDWSSDVCSSDLRRRVQDARDELFPVAPDVDRGEQAGDADLARKAVRVDAAQFGKRDGIFQPADESRCRTGTPGCDLTSPARTGCARIHFRQAAISV